MEKTIVLGVGGGIAAYKSATVASMLMKCGYNVQVLMTENATKFIQPLTFQALTKNPVVVDTFTEPDASEIAHIAIADRASAYVIAPATANLLAKLAHGLADDMVSTTALAVTTPVIVAPAMNVHMYAHPAVQENLRILRERGVILIDPASGPLACGYTGTGRLPEPEDIVKVVQAVIHPVTDFAGLRVLVTAGPTVEDIDPVRFLSNNSSGKMGYALAEVARNRGASVELVTGPTHLPPVDGVRMHRIRSTNDMLTAVQSLIDSCDIFVSAAAPADFRPLVVQEHKWKKTDGIPVLELTQNPDILLEMSNRKQAQQTFVGFAAETRHAVEYAGGKLERKKLDMVVANNVSEEGAGFAVDTNRVTLIRRDVDPETLPMLPKHEVAERILDETLTIHLLKQNHGSH